MLALGIGSIVIGVIKNNGIILSLFGTAQPLYPTCLALILCSVIMP